MDNSEPQTVFQQYPISAPMEEPIDAAGHGHPFPDAVVPPFVPPPYVQQYYSPPITSNFTESAPTTHFEVPISEPVPPKKFRCSMCVGFSPHCPDWRVWQWLIWLTCIILFFSLAATQVFLWKTFVVDELANSYNVNGTYSLPWFQVGSSAKAVFAIGQFSVGIIAIGQFAQGVIVIGQLGLGIINISMVGVGLLFSVGLASGTCGIGTYMAGVSFYSFGSMTGISLLRSVNCLLSVQCISPFFYRTNVREGVDEQIDQTNNIMGGTAGHLISSSTANCRSNQ